MERRKRREEEGESGSSVSILMIKTESRKGHLVILSELKSKFLWKSEISQRQQ